MSKLKRAKAAKPEPEPPRRPRAIASLFQDESDQWPVFSFARVDGDYQGEWGWHLLRKEHDIVGLLRAWSGSKWHELRAMTAGAHKRHHWQAVASLTKAARDRLAELNWDMDEIFRFRHGNKARLWGFEAQGVFYPIWWDPEHKVYPTEPD